VTLPRGSAAFLEVLGLAPELPTPRFFEELFVRFAAAVPYETLTRRIVPPGPFDAEAYFERAAGAPAPLVGGERTEALLALAKGLGFDAFRSRVRSRRGAHGALVARFGGQRVLADPAWPVPVLVPLEPPAHEVPTPYGALTAGRDGNTAALVSDGRGTEREILRVEAGDVPPDEELAAPADPSAPFALRLLPDRVHFWREGLLTVADAWSRLRAPLAGTEAAALRTLFALEGDLPGDLPGAAAGLAELTVWHRVYGEAAGVRARLGRVRPPAADEGIAALRFEVEPLGDGLRLRAKATLAARAPAAGLPEAARKSLVFRLASDLFDAAR
jgi:hypothetical protein